MYLIRIHIVISWVYLCRRNKNVERSSMKKLFLLRFSVAAFFCLLCVLPALAANIKIKGAVKDKLSKEPLIGATIRLVGTPAGAVTDMDGNFELNSTGVLEGLYDIEIKYVGYKTEVRPCRKRKTGDSESGVGDRCARTFGRCGGSKEES